MALTDYDRDLIRGCLAGEDASWRALVDRFVGLVTHVANDTADRRGIPLSAADREDCVAEVFTALLDRDFAVLRRFQGKSSLATYLAVVARRLITRRLLARKLGVVSAGAAESVAAPADSPSIEERIGNEDEVEQMLGGLPAQEATVVRLFHLEGKTYTEISRVVGVPVNTIGPVLTRARQRLRRRAGVGEQAAG